MRAWDYMPGVPAAGHITASGFWHPGPAQGCHKCEPPAPRRRRLPDARQIDAMFAGLVEDAEQRNCP